MTVESSGNALKTISISGSNNDVNVIIESNSARISETADLIPDTFTNLVDICGNLVSLSSELTTLSSGVTTLSSVVTTLSSEVTTLSGDVVTNTSNISSNTTYGINLQNAMDNLVRLTYTNSLSKVLDCSYHYPPPFESNLTKFDTKLRKVSITGISSENISSGEYYKFKTYATAEASLNTLISLQNYTDATETPFILGYNELNAGSFEPSGNIKKITNDPSNIPNFTSESYKEVKGFGDIVFQQDTINAMGSMANCNGQAIETILRLADPIYIKNPDISNIAGALPGAIPIYTISGVSENFNYIIQNKDGEFAPHVYGPSFNKIDASGTWADRFCTWCGISGEMNNNVSFQDISDAAIQNYLTFFFAMQKIYKIERLEQYKILNLTDKYVGQLFHDPSGITGCSGEGIGFTQFPSYSYIMTNFKKYVDNLVDVSSSVFNGENIVGSLITPAAASIEVLGYKHENLDANVVLDSSYNNTVGVSMRIFLFHFASMFAMSYHDPDNEMDPSAVTFYQNLTYPVNNKDLSWIDISAGIDFSYNYNLPQILQNNPIMTDLEYKLKNTYVICNNIGLGGSNKTLWDNCVGQAIINMYKNIWENMFTPGSSKNSVNDFYNYTFMTDFFTQILAADCGYRTKNPNIGVGAYGATVLTIEQMNNLAETTNKINYKILSELRNNLDTSNNNYAFYGTFGDALSTTSAKGIAGNLEAFESLNEPILTNTECPCFVVPTSY